MAATTGELRQEIAQRRDDISRDLDALGDKVSPGRIAHRRTEKVASRMRGMREAVMGTVDDAGERAQDLGGQVTQTAREAPEMARERIEGSPLAAGMIAFGAGALVAALLPPSRPERDVARMAAPAVQAAGDELRTAGSQLVDDLREPAQQAAEQLKQTATDAAQDVRSAVPSAPASAPPPPPPATSF
jgi:ElaB/YqjD/DUF883 family membrane-anchored ribosome-binding protein